MVGRMPEESTSAGDGAVEHQAFPGVTAAYDFVLPSYSLMSARFDAANTRLQNVAGFTAAVFFAAVALVEGLKVEASYQSVWFIGGTIAAALAVSTSICGITTGAVRLVDPGDLFDNHLDLAGWEFKKNLIYYAGCDFRANRSAITKKHLTLVAGLIFAAIAVAMLTAWAAFGDQVVEQAPTERGVSDVQDGLRERVLMEAYGSVFLDFDHPSWLALAAPARIRAPSGRSRVPYARSASAPDGGEPLRFPDRPRVPRRNRAPGR